MNVVRLIQRMDSGGPLTRKDLEDQTFKAWSKAEGEERHRLESVLRELLKNHAQAVMYAILRKADPELLVEASDKVMLNIEKFRGDSLFTTWAHRIIMGVMYDQRRKNRRRKEFSLDVPGFDLPGDPSIGISDVLLTVRKLLSPGDFVLFERVLIEGMTHDEVAKSLAIPKATLTRKWGKILRKLRNAFTK